MRVAYIAFGLLLIAGLSQGSGRFKRNPHKMKHRYMQEKKGNTRDIPGYMLPTNLAPSHQLIQVQPFLNLNSSFNGYTEITFSVLTTTREITIHQLGLTLDLPSVQVEEVSSGASIPISNQTENAETEMYTTTVAQDLTVGEDYIIKINYVGPLNDFTSGFYEATYIDINGVHNYAVTDFEPTDARRAFPTFDEPAMKSTFTLEIIREDILLSSSNMPLVSSEPVVDQPGWTLDTYAATVVMPTYLVAFQVSDMGLASITDDRYSYGIYAPQQRMNETDYSLFLGPNITRFFEDYFNVLYAMPKQDMLALTEFSSGAMENWGCITYRDEYLLYDPETSTVSDQEFICTIVSHELAHQWFGNYVTMQYWEYLWLNEGLATFYEYFGCGNAEPTYAYEEAMQENAMHYVMEFDSFITSDPVVGSYDHPSELGGAFNVYTYSKGGSVFRMMQYFVTEATTRAAENDYLQQFAFGNTVQTDMFQAFNNRAMLDGTLDPNYDVGTIMANWTLLPGYPVLTVIRADDGTASLTQNRFLNSNISTSDTEWWIPITFTTQSLPDFDVFDEQWMLPGDVGLRISGLPATTEWVIFNVRQGGYYRVNYDQNNWDLLNNQLSTDPSVIHVLNRAQIVDDSDALARAGLLSYSFALQINDYLALETSYYPISAAVSNHEYLEKMFRGTSYYDDVSLYLKSVILPIYNSVGFQDVLDQTPEDKKKRSLITSWVCELGHEPCISISKGLYKQWMENSKIPNSISPNVRYSVYCSAIANGGEAEWNFAYDAYKGTNQPHEKLNLLYAMGCSKDKNILKRYLDKAFSSTGSFSKGHLEDIIESVAEHAAGVDVVWDYMKENTHTIANYIGSFRGIADYVQKVAGSFNCEVKLQELKEFKAKCAAVLGHDAAKAFDVVIERTQINISWMENYYEEVGKWIAERMYKVS